MRLRVAGLTLLAAAIALHFGVTLPAWRAAAASQDGYRLARDTRRGLGQRLAAAEKRAAARQRLLGVIEAAKRGPGEDVARLRRDAIAAAREAGVSGVRLEVAAGRGPASASLRMAADGSLRSVAALTADLPLRGVVLESARLAPTDAGMLEVELSGVRPGGLP